MLSQGREPALTPIALQSPTVQLCDGHEGNAKEVPSEQLPIRRGERVTLKEVRDDRRINDESSHAASGVWPRQSRRASSNPSLIWSSGQPPSSSSIRSTGRTPCWRASSSKEYPRQKAPAGDSITAGLRRSFVLGVGTEYLQSSSKLSLLRIPHSAKVLPVRRRRRPRPSRRRPHPGTVLPAAVPVWLRREISPSGPARCRLPSRRRCRRPCLR